MKKSKLIISILFIILIVVEICIGAYLTYCDFMDGPDDDIFGDVFLFESAIVVGSFIIIPELEIWHIILYFVSDKKCKKVYKTILNSIEGVIVVSLFIFILNDFFNFLSIDLSENIFWIGLITYAAVKFIHFTVWEIKEE